jgi:hypothetical protein
MIVKEEKAQIEVVENENQEFVSQGIVAELGELGAGAIVSESALAKMMKRHPVSIKRAVQYGRSAQLSSTSRNG